MMARSSSTPDASTVSPDLAALIAECEAVHAEITALHADDRLSEAPTARACALRASIAGFRPAGMADVRAKAAMVGRLWDFPALQAETAEMIGTGGVGLDDLALCALCDLIGIGEGGTDNIAAPPPDPIFALIEARARALAAYDAWADSHGGTEQKPEGWFEEEKALLGPTRTAYEQMISTVPTTAAGRLALLDRLHVEAQLQGMAPGFAPELESGFWDEFFGSLRGALGGSSSAPVQAGTLGAVGNEAAELLRELEECQRRRAPLTIEQEETPEGQALYERHWDVLVRIDGLPGVSLECLGVKARAGLIALKWDEGIECEGPGPYRSLAQQVMRGVCAQSAPTDADPHLAYRDRLITGIVERWAAKALGSVEPADAVLIEERAQRIVWHRLDDLVAEVVDLPPPQTLQGLGTLAMAAAAHFETSIGEDGDYPEERIAAALIRAVLAFTGAPLPPVFIGFGDEPDYSARDAAAFDGLYALPGWALTAAAAKP